MKNFKVTIQYDGTRYKGWQGQNSTENTIQGKIEAVLETMANHPVEITGSGRTDAGVHARGQVANFHLEEHYQKKDIISYLNQYLPDDIAVVSIKEVEERFHSRFSAMEKTYLYRIQNSAVSNVFERKYMYQYEPKLDVERMRKAAELLIGTHDFTAFCGNKKMKKSPVRTINDIRIEQKEQEVDFYFCGNGFLQNMVRILTGTLIEIGDGRREPEEITAILESKDRQNAGYTAPACGLTLLEVKYEK